MAAWTSYNVVGVPAVTDFSAGQSTLWNAVPFKVINGPALSSGTTSFKKYRGWSVPLAQYVYWVEPATAPAGVDSNSITEVSVVTS
jgi:hypothetical protein